MKILVVLEYPMLYTEFQGHRPLGSEVEDFLNFSPYMGMFIRPGTFEKKIISHIPWSSAGRFVSPVCISG